ncbi:tyrosine-type recombinase/integrase [Selenomonadales bacterium OttesenSCG-928-I06]|nr:tyrosine-type recombinase/integrase [Selenomonadales bacterium OttesenSCG-928-I06]
MPVITILFSANPCVDIRTPKLEKRLPTFLDTLEIAGLLDQPDCTTLLGMRDKVILEILYATGVRVAELASICFRDIDVKERVILVTGKGSKERVVLIGKSAIEAFEKSGEVRGPVAIIRGLSLGISFTSSFIIVILG